MEHISDYRRGGEFVNKSGKPIVEVGAVPEKIEQVIKEHLLK